MKNTLLYFITGVGFLLQTSCSGFLDKMPGNSLEQSVALKNVQDCESSLNGIYALWESTGLYSNHLTIVPDLQCDLAYSVVGTSNQLGNIYAWNFTSTDGDLSSVYSSLYKVISSVNLLLDNKDNITVKATEQSAFNNLLGEAYFSRALAYSELVKLYADAYDPAKAESQAGVSIWNTFGAGKPERASLAANYQQILSDLEKAEGLVSYNEADAKRITTGAVNALYARIYLYMNRWQDAIGAASRVIDNPAYSLTDATAFTLSNDTASGINTTGFYQMWEKDKADEIIWKLAYTTTDRPGTLGYRFCYFNGYKYQVDYIPAVSVLKLYDKKDGRKYTYFTFVPINGEHNYILNKYPGNPELRPATAHVYSNMPKVFRLAEMYLIRAEAYARNNQDAPANADLSTLRTKRIQEYVHTSVNGTTLLDEIKNERIKELYMEGYRLYDLKRYHEGFIRTPQAQSIEPDNKLNILPENFRFTWPIPSHEMDANINMKQNPGY